MDTQIESERDIFLEKVNSLFSDIEKWLKDTELKTSRSEISINEEACGVYNAPTLIITDQEGSKIADITPIGAWIIAANGRVDINGTVDKAIIVDLNEGGPSMTTTIAVEGQVESSYKRYFYQGINEAGWYWIENSKAANGHKLTAELFFKLLAEVSDYE